METAGVAKEKATAASAGVGQIRTEPHDGFAVPAPPKKKQRKAFPSKDATVDDVCKWARSFVAEGTTHPFTEDDLKKLRSHDVDGKALRLPATLVKYELSTEAFSFIDDERAAFFEGLEEKTAALSERNVALTQDKAALAQDKASLERRLAEMETLEQRDIGLAWLPNSPSELSEAVVKRDCPQAKVTSCPAFYHALRCFYADDDDAEYTDELKAAEAKLEQLLVDMGGTEGYATIMDLQCELASSGMIAARLHEAIGLPTIHQVNMECRKVKTMVRCPVDIGIFKGEWSEIKQAPMAAFIEVGEATANDADTRLPQAYAFALTAIQQNAKLTCEGYTTVLGVTLCVDTSEASKEWRLKVWAFAPIRRVVKKKKADADKAAGKVAEATGKSKAGPEPVKTPLARCLLFSGVLGHLPQVVVGLARFARTCYGKHRGMDTERTAWSNVLIQEDGDAKKWVYKAYDNRYREDEEFKRDHSLNLKHIAGAGLVLAKDDGLVIMRYPYLEGSHLPTEVVQVARLLEKLAELHASNVCHGDLRLYNMVFGKEVSWLIDFDFAGQPGEAKYPPYYNSNLADGKRHLEAEANATLQKEHDLFAMAACMRLVKCEEEEGEAQWQAACQLVESGQLEGAIVKLKGLGTQRLRANG